MYFPLESTKLSSDLALKDIRVKVDNPGVFVGGDIFKVDDEIINELIKKGDEAKIKGDLINEALNHRAAIELLHKKHGIRLNDKESNLAYQFNSAIIHCINIIENLENYPNTEVVIVNRFGQELYNSSNYDNSWSGTNGGKQLPDGTYYYVVKLKDSDKVFKGGVTVINAK